MPRYDTKQRRGTSHIVPSATMVHQTRYCAANSQPLRARKGIATRLLFPALLLALYPFCHFQTGTATDAFLYWMAHANLFHLALNMLSAWMLVKKVSHLPILLAGCVIPALLWPIPEPACGASAGLYALAAFRVESGRNAKAMAWFTFSLALSAALPHMANTLHLGGTAVGIAAAFLKRKYDAHRIQSNQGGARA